MKGLMPVLLLITPIVLLQALMGCESVPPTVQPNWVITPVTDFRSMAGKWGGILKRHPAPPRGEGDWIRVEIKEDGSYQFASYRGVGIYSGNGTMTLNDGKALIKTERGAATLSLYTADGRRMIRTVGKTNDGNQEYAADLEPTN